METDTLTVLLFPIWGIKGSFFGCFLLWIIWSQLSDWTEQVCITFHNGIWINKSFQYLLLNHGRASLSGVLLGELGGNAHLLLDLLLMLLLLLLLLLLLGVRRLLNMLQPKLGQVNLTWVFARVALSWWDGWSSYHYTGWLCRWRWFLNYQVTCKRQKRDKSLCISSRQKEKTLWLLYFSPKIKPHG